MKKLYIVLLSLCVFHFTHAQELNQDSVYMRQQYDKQEYFIPMRDGIKLFTLVYTPKDKSKKYPILINRTCYNVSNYSDYKTYNIPFDDTFFPFLFKRKSFQYEREVRIISDVTQNNIVIN